MTIAFVLSLQKHPYLLHFSMLLLQGFWELDLNAWDLAAGALLVEESGGQCSDTEGNAYNLRVRHMVATNGKGNIHSGLLEAMKVTNSTQKDVIEA